MTLKGKIILYRICSYVCDIVNENLDDKIYDFCLLVFFLSALNPN